MCMYFVGVCARARACVCSSVYWGCFRYDNYIQGMQLCVCIFVGGCAHARVCVCVFGCVGAVSVMRTTYRGCNCVYAFCVSSFLRFLCCFLTTSQPRNNLFFYLRFCHT